MLDIKVPSAGESISEVQIGQWLVREGDWVAKDQPVVDLETEKAAMQVNAPQSGFIREICQAEGNFANVGDVLCRLEPAEPPSEISKSGQTAGSDAIPPEKSTQPADSQASAAAPRHPGEPSDSFPLRPHVMPAAQRILAEKGIDSDQIRGSGPGGRVLKEDALAAASSRGGRSSEAAAAPPGKIDLSQSSRQSSAKTNPGNTTLVFPSSPSHDPIATQPQNPVASALSVNDGRPDRVEEVRPLSMIRRTIANRLVAAQQTAALLTTFNEVNMQPIMELRNKYRDAFQQRHGVKLGLMSFFTKASVEALRRFPSVNAEIRGNNIVYRNFMDIGIAIGSGKGLVVPVLRNAEHMSFAEIERAIGQFAAKAMENRLMPEDLTGGTFTISNGGVYGSMLSTPIVNPPQSAILGLHAIQERPMAVQGQVVILPMMYLALTYDHRIIDGREAVTFLRTIKEICEDPARLFLEI